MVGAEFLDCQFRLCDFYRIACWLLSGILSVFVQPGQSIERYFQGRAVSLSAKERARHDSIHGVNRIDHWNNRGLPAN